MWLTIVILIVLAAVIDFYRKKHMDKKLNITGKTPFPFLGNVPQYINLSPEEFLELAKTDVKTYGGLFRVWVFNKMEFAVLDPEAVEHILNNPKHITKNQMYDLLSPWLSTGLLLSTGAKWFSRRKILTPAFHFSILEQFIQIFDEQSNILVEELRPHAENGKAFDIYSYITLAALDTMSESALGVKVNAQKDPECPYVKAIHEFSAITTERFLKIHLRPPILFSILAPRMKRRLDELLKTLHSFTKKIIEERRELLQRTLNLTEDILDKNGHNDGKKKRMAFLDILLQASVDGKPLSDEDIREEVDTFTFEGHDTTTSGMCFTLYLISRHPEVQRRVFEEVQDVFGNDKRRAATYKDLVQLKYTELVIKEALRMYPPVPFFGRILGEDLKIKGTIIPAGSSVSIGPIVSMKDSRYFPDPHKFIPERHSVEVNAEDLNPFAYIPFSAGPRNCIGQKFAMFEMKSFISKILRHYELVPLGEDMKPFVHLILRSRNGFQMGLKPRDY